MNSLNPFNGCLKFDCLYCGQHMECEPRLAGRQLLCPACQHRIVIPTTLGGLVRQTLPTVFTWDDFVPLPASEIPAGCQGAAV